jgi:pimeloyl-ACP methyl ester carboxylesterase
MARFETDLSDDSRGALYDLDGDNDSAIIAFGGLWMRMGGLPPFEFFGQLDDIPSGLVFVRDLEQSWYQFGIRGAADDIRASAKWLSDLLETHGIRRIVCVGCSAGGFAAIVFGSLIGATEIHAFCAQTTIARLGLWRAHDKRWNQYLKPMRKQLGARRPIFDARSVLSTDTPNPHIYVHWGTNEKRDGRHALRLDGLPNVTLVPHNGVGHGDLTRSLRDSGELRRLLLQSLA